MRSVETEGASIDDAIARALTALGADRDHVEVEILDNARRGVFGIGRKAARVRATMRAPLNWLEAVPLDDVETTAGEAASYAAVKAPSRDGAPRMPRRDPDRTGGPAATSVDAIQFLAGLFQRMGIDASARAHAGDALAIEIGGRDAEDLIARRGELLDALEHVVNRAAERAGNESPRHTLDVAGYRERRHARLLALAERVAEKARSKGKPVTLNPMPPAELRTLQTALHSLRGIATRTVGQGLHRKLVVIPEAARRRSGKPEQ